MVDTLSLSMIAASLRRNINVLDSSVESRDIQKISVSMKKVKVGMEKIEKAISRLEK